MVLDRLVECLEIVTHAVVIKAEWRRRYTHRRQVFGGMTQERRKISCLAFVVAPVVILDQVPYKLLTLNRIVLKVVHRVLGLRITKAKTMLAVKRSIVVEHRFAGHFKLNSDCWLQDGVS